MNTKIYIKAIHPYFNTTDSNIKNPNIINIPYKKNKVITVDNSNPQCIPECYINCETQFVIEEKIRYCIVNMCKCIEINSDLLKKNTNNMLYNSNSDNVKFIEKCGNII